MTVDEFKMIAKQYGYDFNPLYENLGQLRIHIDNIWTEDKMLVVYNGRIQMYKRMIKVKQIKSIANAETID